MKNRKKRLIVLSSLTLIGASTAVALTLQNGGSFFSEPASAQVPADFVEAEITRRVYFINNDNYWDEGWTEEAMSHLYVHAWQESDGNYKTETPVAATRLMDDVLHGLYYADVTFSGAGDRIGVIVTTSSTWAGVQSDGAILPTLWSTSPDVIYLNNGLNEGNRRVSVGSVNSMSDSQMAFFLSNYQTCSNAYTDGYNAYPQVMKDFCPEGKIYEPTTVVTDYDYTKYVENGNSYEGLAKDGSTTINDKLVKMQSMFETNGYETSNYHVPFKFGNEPYTCVNSRTETEISYTGVTGNSYANVYSYIPDLPSNAVGIKFLITNKTESYIRIDADVGSGAPLVSHLVRTGEGEDWSPYDWFNTSNNRAHYGLEASVSREVTFLFDQSLGTVDGFLMFVDSAYEAADLHSGDILISNAVYLF